VNRVAFHVFFKVFFKGIAAVQKQKSRIFMQCGSFPKK